MLLHYLGKLKNQKFALLVHVKHVLNVTLSSIQQILPVKCHKNKCKDQHYAFYFLFTFLNKIKALQLSKAGLSTIKHHHSKKSDTMDRSHLNQRHEKCSLIVCKSLFTKGVQMPSICTDTCLETFSALVCPVRAPGP